MLYSHLSYKHILFYMYVNSTTRVVMKRKGKTLYYIFRKSVHKCFLIISTTCQYIYDLFDLLCNKFAWSVIFWGTLMMMEEQFSYRMTLILGRLIL